MKIDQKKINAFLSERTGMVNECIYLFDDCNLGMSNPCEECDAKQSAPFDFFTPDGMVRLMEWWKARDGKIDEVKVWQRCRGKWGVVFESYDTESNEQRTIRTGYGYAQADTPQAALAQAAYVALGIKEIEV